MSRIDDFYRGGEGRRELALIAVKDIANATKRLNGILEALAADGVWTELRDSAGKPWPTLEAFIRAPLESGGLALVRHAPAPARGVLQ